MNASIAIQVLPKVDSTQEVVRVVDAVIEFIRQTGNHYQVGAFETTVEGDFEELMDIAKQCHYIAIQEGADKVSTYIKVSYNPKGDSLTIDEKTLKHAQ